MLTDSIVYYTYITCAGQAELCETVVQQLGSSVKEGHRALQDPLLKRMLEICPELATRCVTHHYYVTVYRVVARPAVVHAILHCHCCTVYNCAHSVPNKGTYIWHCFA
jgi:hypothetical protein